jgi:hypothetical protein
MLCLLLGRISIQIDIVRTAKYLQMTNGHVSFDSIHNFGSSFLKEKLLNEVKKRKFLAFKKHNQHSKVKFFEVDSFYLFYSHLEGLFSK